MKHRQVESEAAGRLWKLKSVELRLERVVVVLVAGREECQRVWVAKGN